MRLTKAAKENVISAILSDVPKVKYQTQAETLLRELCHEILPEAVLKVAKDPELQFRLQVGYPCIYSGGGYHGLRIQIAVRGWDDGEKADKKKLFAHPRIDEVIELAKRSDIQAKARAAMREDLYGMFMTVNTRKQFEDRFPEFVRYLPVKAEPSSNLPADPAVFTKLIAMGWKPQ